MGDFVASMACCRFHSILVAGLIISCAIADDFSTDVETTFFKGTTMDEVKAEMEATGKPGVIMVTQPWCGACKGLKRSINEDKDLQKLMRDRFVVVHASGDAGKVWQYPDQNDG